MLRKRTVQKGNIRRKEVCSRQWKAKKNQQLKKEVDLAWDLLVEEGLIPQQMVACDKFGNTCSSGINVEGSEHTKLSVDKAMVS